MDEEEMRRLREKYTCHICSELYKEATALRKCNHIFCWKCITSKIRLSNWQCCPDCYTELGPEPLVKLRHDDPILVSMERNNLFPKLEPKLEEDGSEHENIETDAADEENESQEMETDSEDEYTDSEDEYTESENEYTESENEYTDSEDGMA